MASSLNKKPLGEDNIINAISSDKFSEFTPEMQQEILKQIEKRNQRDGGFMGKFFGHKKELASMNIAFIICVLLLIAGAVVGTQEFWNGILPVFGATIGYIFGKSNNKSE